MASKSQEKREAVQTEAVNQKMVWKYSCPACTNIAITTTNKMLGVEVDCQSCGKRIKLDNEKNYTKI